MKKNKKENLLINLLFNIAIPVIIMTKFSKDIYLGPLWGLIIALLFPVAYALYDFIQRKNLNVISMLGFISILLTGVIGLFELNAFWIAIKEALVPLIIAVFILATKNSEKSLVPKLLLNDEMFNTELLYSTLHEKNKMQEFSHSMNTSSLYVAASFLLSSTLNFSLARIILQSPPGSSEYIEELGKMQALSFPVIALPCTIILVAVLLLLFKRIKTLTGLQFEELMKK